MKQSTEKITCEKGYVDLTESELHVLLNLFNDRYRKYEIEWKSTDTLIGKTMSISLNSDVILAGEIRRVKGDQ